jgi:hypothetical protein
MVSYLPSEKLLIKPIPAKLRVIIASGTVVLAITIFLTIVFTPAGAVYKVVVAVLGVPAYNFLGLAGIYLTPIQYMISNSSIAFSILLRLAAFKGVPDCVTVPGLATSVTCVDVSPDLSYRFGNCTTRSVQLVF